MKLCIPPRVLEQHLVVLGKTGAGKSSALRHIVEHLLSHNKRVCIVDIKGDWYGLKISADGKSPGFPVIAFGDFRDPKASDVPINAQSGKHVAELIVSGNRPCIIGFRGWMIGHITDFWLDFAQTLFNKNEGELYVVISECHNFAPKGKVLDPKAGRVLHWTNRLLSEGRGLGMTFLLDSQRPQKVHNDTLTCCETLVAMRVTHAADRQALKDWIDGCGDKATGTELLNNVAGLARGEAYVWSPEIGFGPQRLQFPMFETFDSFAPAQLQKKVNQSGWAAVDLEAVKVKMAAVIEEAKSNDPKELKARIRQLEQQAASKGPAKSDPQEIERAIKKRDSQWLLAVTNHRRGIEEFHAKVALDLTAVLMAPSPILIAPEVGSQFPTTIEGVKHEVLDRQLPPGKLPLVRNVHFHANSNGSGESLPRSERRILTALAQYPQGRGKIQIALLTGYAHSGGGFNNSLSALRTKGHMEGQDPYRITQAGVDALGSFEPLPVGSELLNYWHKNLGKAESSILTVVSAHHPRAVSKEDIAAAAGYAADGGGFNNAISRLRTLELISGRQELRASDDLFG
jgi:hypothetical protein